MSTKNKEYLSIITLLSAIVVGFLALFLPPQGVIDSSVLWWSAQLLVFTATILGYDVSIDNFRQVIKSQKNNEEKE